MSSSFASSENSKQLNAQISGLSLESTRVLIVDPQKDFTIQFEGSLGVQGTEADSGYVARVIKATKALKKHGFTILATKDWHPNDHTSFASQHKGKKPFEIITLERMMPSGTIQSYTQILWPDHCVQQSQGAEFFIPIKLIDKFFEKGTRKEFDSYSGLKDDGNQQTELSSYLDTNKQITTLIVYGLATDYCVKATVMDAVTRGLFVIFIKNLSNAVNPVDGDKAIEEMLATGKVAVIESI